MVINKYLFNLNDLVKKLYDFSDNSINISNILNFYSQSFVIDKKRKITNLLNRLYDATKYILLKIYKIPEKWFENVQIYFVDNLPSIYQNTITLGMYISYRVANEIKNATILLPRWLLQYPKKFVETLAHELTHYIEDRLGRIKKSSLNHQSFESYYNSKEEIIARIIGKFVSDYLFGKFYIYGRNRMYIL